MSNYAKDPSRRDIEVRLAGVYQRVVREMSGAYNPLVTAIWTEAVLHAKATSFEVIETRAAIVESLATVLAELCGNSISDGYTLAECKRATRWYTRRGVPS